MRRGSCISGISIVPVTVRMFSSISESVPCGRTFHDGCVSLMRRSRSRWRPPYRRPGGAAVGLRLSPGADRSGPPPAGAGDQLTERSCAAAFSLLSAVESIFIWRLELARRGDHRHHRLDRR